MKRLRDLLIAGVVFFALGAAVVVGLQRSGAISPSLIPSVNTASQEREDLPPCCRAEAQGNKSLEAAPIAPSEPAGESESK